VSNSSHADSLSVSRRAIVRIAEAPKVEKYRAVEDFKGEIDFPKGATLFVLGDADASGNFTVRFIRVCCLISVFFFVCLSDCLS